MKTFTRISLILASVLGVVGLSCIIAAFAMGLNFTNIKGMIADGFFTFDSSDFDFDFGETSGESSEKIIAEDCEKMEIEFGAGQLDIYYDDVDEIQVKWVNLSNLKIEVKNGSLQIGEKGVNLSIGVNEERKMEIILPRGTQFELVDLEVGAGQATIKGLNTEKFDLEVGAGQVDVLDLVIEKMDLEVGAGQINAKLSGAQEDYNYKVNCGIGRVEVGSNSYGGLGAEQSVKNDDATKEMDIDCGVGEVKIQFEK